MFWADRIAEDAKKRFGATPILIRDEKTLSGRVHIGSMRGVAVHGVVHESLTGAGVGSTFKYEFNDNDPMDDIPSYLDQAVFKEHLGKPLKNIPSPEPGFKNFAEYFGAEFQKVIEAAGWHPEFYRCSELYESGKMDSVIREALSHAQDIVRIYKEVSGSQREDQWLPINVVCPQCGKVTTTESSDFDGETLQVHCRPDKVTYTRGCDFAGRVSPFGGAAKLPWKVEWPAKWKVVGVMLEGAGKDHSTKGGSRDVAAHISKEVFNYEVPMDAPYEFILVGGKKMSSSKGRGSSAKEIADLLPPQMFRLMLLGKDMAQQVNFDPEGDTIPVLYDQYDKLAEQYQTVKDDDYARLFEFIHPEHKVTEAKFFMRFSQVAFVVQMPHMDLLKEAETLKGSALTEAERAELMERAEYAKRWLELYAPEKYVFKLHDELPEVACALTDSAKAALKTVYELIAASETMPSGEELQAKLHETKEFKAVYLAFLGKESGPKAGWFLSSLPRELVLKRLEEASK